MSKDIKEDITVSWGNFLAVRIASISLETDTISEINNYIDSTTYKDILTYDKSMDLVGQTRQDKKSAQLYMPLSDEVPSSFAEYLSDIAGYYAADHGVEVRKSIVQSMWSVHNYAGDYNPLHDHHLADKAEFREPDSGLSCILYLKVPEEISSLPPMNGGEFQYGNSGFCDGHTQFVWGSTSKSDRLAFKQPSNIYIKPKEGLLLMFPLWLQHLVQPFYGDGERRSLSANIALYV